MASLSALMVRHCQAVERSPDHTRRRETRVRASAAEEVAYHYATEFWHPDHWFGEQRPSLVPSASFGSVRASATLVQDLVQPIRDHVDWLYVTGEDEGDQRALTAAVLHHNTLQGLPSDGGGHERAESATLALMALDREIEKLERELES